MRPIGFRNRKRRAGRQVYGRSHRYHTFGKVNDPYEDFAYSLSLDGADEFESNEGFGDNSSLVYGPFDPAMLRSFYGDNFGFLTRSERTEIKTWAGFILHEDSQGLISVQTYTDRAKLDEAWERVAESYSSYEEDEIDPEILDAMNNHGQD